LVLQTEDAQSDSTAQRTELQRQASLLIAQQDRLLNIHLAGDIDQQAFAQKQIELRDCLASIKLQLDVLDRSRTSTDDCDLSSVSINAVLDKFGYGLQGIGLGNRNDIDGIPVIADAKLAGLLVPRFSSGRSGHSLRFLRVLQSGRRIARDGSIHSS
jgi:hypothetical protein